MLVAAGPYLKIELATDCVLRVSHILVQQVWVHHLPPRVSRIGEYDGRLNCGDQA